MQVEIHSVDLGRGTKGKTQRISSPPKLEAYPGNNKKLSLLLKTSDTEVLSSGERGGDGKFIDKNAEVFLNSEDLKSLFTFYADPDISLPEIDSVTLLMLARKLIDQALK